MALVYPMKPEASWLQRLKKQTEGVVKVARVYAGSSVDEYQVKVPASLVLSDDQLVAIADGYRVANWGGNVRTMGQEKRLNGYKLYQVRVYRD